MKKIVKIITFYDDGTFSESYPSPTIPTMPFPFQPYEVTSQCRQCGLKLDKTMGYVCSSPTCPTGLGPVMCQAVTDCV